MHSSVVPSLHGSQTPSHPIQLSRFSGLPTLGLSPLSPAGGQQPHSGPVGKWQHRLPVQSHSPQEQVGS